MNQINHLIEKASPHLDMNDYSNYLRKFGIDKYNEVGYYLKIGEQNLKEGWLFHISISRKHFSILINELIPYLLRHNYIFMLPKNSEAHKMIQQSYFGYINTGKIITIYPHRETDLCKLAKDLMNLTKGFIGPTVPTDIHLGEIIYTKYESYDDVEPKFITDPKGNKIIDEEAIPFKLYPWINWPFIDIVKPIRPKTGRIINNKYLIRKIIKSDTKGNVIKVLLQKNLFKYKNCIIKEGKFGMGEDNYGRYIEDRLIWQKSLHDKLFQSIQVPCAIDYFKNNSNTYLVLSYINGISLGHILAYIFEGKHWNDTDIKIRIKIIEILISIVILVNKLHKLNIIHRDLNANNFLITKKNEVWLIDLELAYDLSSNFPNPPFEKGTKGYMSPEQEYLFSPKFDQDVFSIGALMIKSIIQFNPSRFDYANPNKLKDKLSFFCHDNDLVDLIMSCVDTDPEKRPLLEKIEIDLQKYKVRILSGPSYFPTFILDRLRLKQTIENSINSLSSPLILDSKNLWLSPLSNAQEFIDYPRFDRTINLGFGNGISGILFLIGKAKSLEFSIENCLSTLIDNWNFLQKKINDKSCLPGLYSGSYGLALGIHSLITNNLIAKNDINIELIINCLSQDPFSLNIESGIAGQGIALLKCKDLLPNDFVDEKIERCINTIILNQTKTGYWITRSNPKNRAEITYTFEQGISGIIYFLLSYIEYSNNETIKGKALFALDYLKNKVKTYNGRKVWTTSSKSRELYEFYNGGYKILWPFIKAFKITHDNTYKHLVEQILLSYPQRLTTELLSQEKGISGLGEIYLDAWNNFNNLEWLHRAEWIAGKLMQLNYGDAPNSHWIQNSPFPSADIFSGNCGIIHFLLRTFSKNKLPYYF